MSYFVISGSEEGLELGHYKTKEQLLEMLEENQITFLDEIPHDYYEFFDLQEKKVLIIQGKVVKPMPVEIVKGYEIK